jgi:hypothetical protein
MQVLAVDGTCCTGDGLVAGDHEQVAFTAQVREQDGNIVGNPIDPVGRITAEAMTLGREWRRIWAPGDLAINVHIPAGGRLDPQACRDSFARAAAFFARHHGDRPATIFTCGTWFLDPQVDDLMPGSNLARFRAMVWNVPIRPDPWLWFVFLQPTDDAASLPRDTSMRRVLVDFLQRGGKWRGGGMVLGLAGPVNVRG